MIGIIIAAAAICVLYLWMIAPSHKHPDASALKGKLYAHRGFHDMEGNATENSLKAFELAVKNGYGIELDVQHTRDDKLVVCHDGDLKRVCGVDKRIRDLTYDELCGIPLPDGTHVPLFEDVLKLVDGKVPLIVEVKHYGSPVRNAEAAWAQLKGYKGAYCVESFHPLAVQYFRKHAPEVIRGQLAWGGKWNGKDTNIAAHFAMKHLLVNAFGRPHFVAYSAPQDKTLAMWLMKHVFKPLLAAWTIRSQELLSETEADYDMPIFERFVPKDKNN